MRLGDFKDIAMAMIFATAAVFISFSITKCEQKNINFTCDYKNKECLKIIDSLSEVKK